MLMQVFIELDRRYQNTMVTVHLYFWGWHYLKSKYQDTRMQSNFTIVVQNQEHEMTVQPGYRFIPGSRGCGTDEDTTGNLN